MEGARQEGREVREVESVAGRVKGRAGREGRRQGLAGVGRVLADELVKQRN